MIGNARSVNGFKSPPKSETTNMGYSEIARPDRSSAFRWAFLRLNRNAHDTTF